MQNDKLLTSMSDPSMVQNKFPDRLLFLFFMKLTDFFQTVKTYLKQELFCSAFNYQKKN